MIQRRACTHVPLVEDEIIGLRVPIPKMEVDDDDDGEEEEEGGGDDGLILAVLVRRTNKTKLCYHWICLIDQSTT